MRLATQILTVALISLRSVPQRLGNSLVIVIGMTGVVAVLLSVLALYTNFRHTIAADGRRDRAIILSNSATAEYDSSLSPADIALLSDAPGIRHNSANKPLVSAEVVLMAPVARRRDNSDVNITMRGVGEQYFAMRPELKIIAGRMPRAGTQELVVGESARSEFTGLDIGNRIRLQGGDWTIVGVYLGNNGSRDSELVGDAQTTMSAYKLAAANTLLVALDSAASLEALRAYLRAQPTLKVVATSEPEYLAGASSTVNHLLRLVAYAVGSIMALGALFAAVNSMHSSVASRKVEIATLRALGFSSLAVAAAVLLESVLLALIGAAAGVAVAYIAFNGTVISTLGGSQYDSQLVYALVITPTLVGIAVAMVCALGLAGAVPPAIHAASGSVAEGLRET